MRSRIDFLLSASYTSFLGDVDVNLLRANNVISICLKSVGVRGIPDTHIVTYIVDRSVTLCSAFCDGFAHALIELRFVLRLTL